MEETPIKTLVYLGNQLSGPGANISLMETHSALLRKHFKVISASDKHNKILRMLDMIWTLCRHGHKAAVVIIAVFSTLNFYYAVILALICRATNKPFIAYLHGGNLPARLERSPRLSKAVFTYAHANVAPSSYLKTAFENAGYKALFIPNFIQISRYPYVERATCQPNLLWVRSFEKTYQPEMTILVFAEVQKIYPEARLCMVGPDKDGSLATCMQLANDLGLTDHIVFTGGLPNDQWVDLAAGYDIFISTPRFDNTPISLLEAMTLGLPIVSTDVGGIPHLIQHGHDGLLSPDMDIHAMVLNIKKLLDAPDLSRSICQHARKKAASFDWDVVENQWLDLIDGISTAQAEHQ